MKFANPTENVLLWFFQFDFVRLSTPPIIQNALYCSCYAMLQTARGWR